MARTKSKKKGKEIHALFTPSQIPNALTIARILLTFVVMYLIFNGNNIFAVVIVFGIAAFTDFLDGKLARRYGWVSEFGRQADMIADRFLWIGTALAFLISFGIRGELNGFIGAQLFVLYLREMISLPFALVSFFSGNMLPPARYIAKVTTFIQGFALPTLILSVFYPTFTYISLPLAVAGGITGTISALYYIHDALIDPKTKP